jgi:hypothetical protein
MPPVIRRVVYGGLAGALLAAAVVPRSRSPELAIAFVFVSVLIALAAMAVSDFVSSIGRSNRPPDKD